MGDSVYRIAMALPSEPETSVTVVGIYAGQQSLVRPIPHWKAQGPVSMRLGMQKGHEALGEREYLVKLDVAAELVQPDGTLALRATTSLEAVVVCVGLSADELAVQLNRVVPARLFSHARVHIEGLTRDSGYRPLVLPPVPMSEEDAPTDSALEASP